MAGIADTDVIDLVAQDGDGRYLAVMIEERPWGIDPDQERQLREKFNTYYTFIATGGYAEQMPEAQGEQVTIQLRCATYPVYGYETLLADAEQRLERAGIGFELMVVDYLRADSA